MGSASAKNGVDENATFIVVLKTFFVNIVLPLSALFKRLFGDSWKIFAISCCNAIYNIREKTKKQKLLRVGVSVKKGKIRDLARI